MFKVNIKDNRTTSRRIVLVLTVNTYFTPFSSVFNAGFKQVNVCWVRKKISAPKL